MSNERARICSECKGEMAPVVVADKVHPMVVGFAGHGLQYRLPGDKPSFWTGHYPSAGSVESFMCAGCGRIQLYGVEQTVE